MDSVGPTSNQILLPPHWEQTPGIIRTLYDFRLVGAGCGEVTDFTVM